jgi:hypothetical protein
MKKLILAGVLAAAFAAVHASQARADGPFLTFLFNQKADYNTGIVPGPWYTYWPYGGGCTMTSPYENPCWVYENNFTMSAPIYPYWPASPTPYSVLSSPGRPTAYPTSGLQPGGYYPSYWYGR